MSAEQLTYLDSSAIVRLVQAAPESSALRLYVRRHRPHVSSALARTEVLRALLPFGPEAVTRGRQALSGIQLVRVDDRVLNVAGELLPLTLRSVDAIHLATARLLGESVSRVVTYDARMQTAAMAMKFKIASPS